MIDCTNERNKACQNMWRRRPTIALLLALGGNTERAAAQLFGGRTSSHPARRGPTNPNTLSRLASKQIDPQGGPGAAALQWKATLASKSNASNARNAWDGLQYRYVPFKNEATAIDPSGALELELHWLGPTGLQQPPEPPTSATWSSP